MPNVGRNTDAPGKPRYFDLNSPGGGEWPEHRLVQDARPDREYVPYPHPIGSATHRGAPATEMIQELHRLGHRTALEIQIKEIETRHGRAARRAASVRQHRLRGVLRYDRGADGRHQLVRFFRRERPRGGGRSSAQRHRQPHDRSRREPLGPARRLPAVGNVDQPRDPRVGWNNSHRPFRRPRRHGTQAGRAGLAGKRRTLPRPLRPHTGDDARRSCTRSTTPAGC